MNGPFLILLLPYFVFQHVSSRFNLIYALLAVRCGELAVAHEELAFAKTGMMSTNLQVISNIYDFFYFFVGIYRMIFLQTFQVYVYTKMGRFCDAIRAMEDSVKKKNNFNDVIDTNSARPPFFS